jgi:4-hydroxybenzoyl-CoA reductase alpha subunit
VDAKPKATGEAKYTADLVRPGMLTGKALRSPYPHARILHIDTERARRVPGVRAVLTAADTPMIPYGLIVPDELPLAATKVRYIGDEVAALAAADADAADEALGLIRVEYEELAAVFDPEEAMRPGAPRVHDEFELNVADHVAFERGDIEAGWREAAVRAEETFRLQCMHQYYMENNACIAEVDATGKLTVWCCLQMLDVERNLLSRALNLPVSRIRIIQPHVGGGFGGKLEQKIPVLTSLLAMKARRPVFMEYSREEELTAARPRVPMTIELKMGARRDGTVCAKEVRVVADNGAYSNWAAGILNTACTRIDSLYRFRNLRAEGFLVYTNKVPTGALRGFGNPQITFAVESMLDVLADRLGMDPAELRLRNATQAGDVTAHGWEIRSCALTECIQKVMALSGWKQKIRDAGNGRGVGMACSIHVAGNRNLGDFDGSSALVRVHQDGRVTVICGEGDIGQGAHTVFVQIAAEELGARVEDVEISEPDTEVAPFSLGAYATRVTTVGGNGVKAAAADARAQLFHVAAKMLHAPPEELDAAESRIFLRGRPERGVTFEDVVRESMFKRDAKPIVGRGLFSVQTTVQHDKKTRYGNVAPAYSFAAQVAEVVVDRETGVVRVLNYYSVDDVGRAINPMAAEGQIEGAIMMGIGYALMEEMVFEEGRVVNVLDYEVPTFGHLPKVHHLLVEPIDPFGPFGAKGVGETPIVPVAGAIANAVARATGARVTSLPITPEKVLRALEGRARGAPVG